MPPTDDPFPDDLFLVEPAYGVRPDSYLDPPSAGLLATDPPPLRPGPAGSDADLDPDLVPAPGADPRLDPGLDPRLDSRLDSGRRPGSRGRRPRAGRAPLPVAVTVAAAWAALTTYGVLLLLTLAVTASTGAGFGATARFAGYAWLLSYGVPVHTPADAVTLIPLALTALAGWRLVRAGIHASRATGAHRTAAAGPALAAGAGVGLAFGVLGAAVAWLMDTVDLSASPLRAGITLGLFAGVAATAGSFGHGRAGRALRRRVLQRAGAAASVVRTGACAAALILAAGAGIAGVALAVHGGDAAAMLASYRTGWLGQAGITVLCLAFAPNVAVWGAAYLLGPGFAVGVDTVVSPGSVVIGPLPGLPVLAGLPSVPLTGLGPTLIGVPVVAGICAGILLARRGPRDPTGRPGWGALLGTAALSGIPAGLLVAAAAAVAGGALGSGRLVRFGSVDWSVGMVAAGVVAFGAVIGAAGTRVLTSTGR